MEPKAVAQKMSAGAQAHWWDTLSRRRVPRYRLRAPVDVTVMRSGIADTMPGRSIDLCESGLAAVLAGELAPGESVGVEIQLPITADPLQARALVRHQDRLRCGMEFVGLSAEQEAAIRAWAEHSKAEAQPEDRKILGSGKGSSEGSSLGPGGPPNRGRRRGIWELLLVLGAVLLAILWWRWNRAWEQLETSLPSHAATIAKEPRVGVAAEVMQKLLLHRVEPDYPEAARKANLQGIVVLDIVVGRDGSVVEVNPVSGPYVLAKSAMDALRWWKFKPYLVNGNPAVVKTTVAVEFKP